MQHQPSVAMWVQCHPGLQFFFQKEAPTPSFNMKSPDLKLLAMIQMF